MNSPSRDLVSVLDGASIGLSYGTNLFRNKRLDSPNEIVVLSDTPGFSPLHAGGRYDYPSVQVYIRGEKGKYDDTYSLAEDIKQELKAVHNQTINSTWYVGVWANSDIIFLRWDEKDRPEFTINFNIQRSL